MKRIVVGVSAFLLAMALSAGTAWAFGMKDVIQMHEYGVPDSLIIIKIQHSGVQFHLNTKDLVKLQQLKISPDVVGAMLRTEHHDGSDGPVYVSPWYPYYGPPFVPGVSMGFHYYYGHPYYYRHSYIGGPAPIAPNPRFRVGVSGSFRS